MRAARRVGTPGPRRQFPPGGYARTVEGETLVTVTVLGLRSDAEIARAVLASAGIRSVVRADDEGGLNPGFFSEYGVRVEVRADEADAARVLLSAGGVG